MNRSGDASKTSFCFHLGTGTIEMTDSTSGERIHKNEGRWACSAGDSVRFALHGETMKDFGDGVQASQLINRIARPFTPLYCMIAIGD
jgi:hypothetical protein